MIELICDIRNSVDLAAVHFQYLQRLSLLKFSAKFSAKFSVKLSVKMRGNQNDNYLDVFEWRDIENSAKVIVWPVKYLYFNQITDGFWFRITVVIDVQFCQITQTFKRYRRTIVQLFSFRITNFTKNRRKLFRKIEVENSSKFRWKLTLLLLKMRHCSLLRSTFGVIGKVFILFARRDNLRSPLIGSSSVSSTTKFLLCSMYKFDSSDCMTIMLLVRERGEFVEGLLDRITYESDIC